MNIKRLSFILFSSVFSFIWLIPLIWLVVTTFTEPTYYMSIIPTTPFTLANIQYILSAAPFGQYYMNTITITLGFSRFNLLQLLLQLLLFL